jgi:hypothetical protein
LRYKPFQGEWNAADKEEDGHADQEDVPDQGCIQGAACSTQTEAAAGQSYAPVEVDAEGHAKADQEEQGDQGAASGPEPQEETEAGRDLDPGYDDGEEVDQREGKDLVSPHGLGEQAGFGDFDQPCPEKRAAQEQTEHQRQDRG